MSCNMLEHGVYMKKTLENTLEAKTNGKSREIVNKGCTRHKTETNKTKTQYNMCWASVTCDTSVVFSINKTDHHDITKLLLKMALNTTILTPEQ